MPRNMVCLALWEGLWLAGGASLWLQKVPGSVPASPDERTWQEGSWKASAWGPGEDPLPIGIGKAGPGGLLLRSRRRWLQPSLRVCSHVVTGGKCPPPAAPGRHGHSVQPAIAEAAV